MGGHSASKWFLILLVCLIASIYVSLVTGRLPTPLNPVEWKGTVEYVVYELRLPRILLAVLIGMGLAATGAAYQSMFKNPLASPKILGTTDGAAVGIAAAIVFIGYNRLVIEAAGFATGLLATLAALYLSRAIRYGGSILRLILAGMAVSAFSSALLGLVKFQADPYQVLPTITFWLLGSLNGKGWGDLAYAGPMIIAGLVVLFLLRWRINILGLSDEEALSLGINPRLYRGIVIASGSLIVSASTSVAGSIAWLGLLMPHLARGLFGADNRYVIPASALIGSILLLLCDTYARSAATYEIPLGIVLSFVSAPIFVVVLSRGALRWRR